MTDIQIEMEALLAEAQEKTGLNDFGSSDFIPGLEALLATYNSNDFTERGKRRCLRRVKDLLAARLNIEDAWKRHPEVLDLPINKPMFLTGLPRTGTSALFNVMANDPATRTLKLWEGLNPWPLDGLGENEIDPRYASIKAHYEKLNAKSDFKKFHYTTADTPEECIHLTNHTFQDQQFGFEIFMEPYASYYRTVDKQQQYQYHADLLRLLQWQRPADRWLLKTPSHVSNLDIIAEKYPDSSMIVTHRNPLAVVGSYCSLMQGVVPERSNENAKQLGPRVLRHLAEQMDQSLKARKTINTDRIIDIHYTDFVNDTKSVVNRIYEHFYLPYTQETRSSIETYVDDHPRGKHGAHNYNLEKFGLDEQQVIDRFADYIDTFDIAV